MLHMCGVVAVESTLKMVSNVANIGRQGILVFYQLNKMGTVAARLLHAPPQGTPGNG